MATMVTRTRIAITLVRTLPVLMPLSCKVESKYLCARASLTRYQVNNAKTDAIRGSEGEKTHFYVMTTINAGLHRKKVRNLD